MNYKSLLIGALGCFIALTANARDIEVDGLYYSTKSDGTATVRAPLSSETKPSGDIVIPASITYDGKDYKVTGIDDNAFAYGYQITGLEIERHRDHRQKRLLQLLGIDRTVVPGIRTEIGDYAFNSCTKVTYIDFPTGLKVAGPIFQSCINLTNVRFNWKCVVTELNGTFQDCRVLPRISIPSTVVSIGDNTFDGCKSLAEVSFSGSNLKTIGDWAFNGNKFTTLEIPEGVEEIGLKKSYALTATINDEDTSAKNLTYTAGVNSVLSYSTYNGKVTSGTKGDAYIYVESSENPAVRGVLVAKVAPIKPVTSITLDGVVDGVLRVPYNSMIAANPVIEPADADLTDFTISIEDPTMCTIYAAKAFNPTRNFYELTTFKLGETNVTYTAADGSGTQLTFKLVVEDRDRETPIDYTKGMFWLNEEWFGHCSGSINFVGDDYTFTGKVYERENPFQAFGATSQFATVYADRLVVMSKQPRDGGDLRGTEAGGGRVVIADAKTLKKIAAFDEIGGDGRAACGVAPDKFYLTHASGVRVCRAQGDTYVLDAADIAGIGGGSAYANQMGDIVAAGNYAFAVQQGTGLHVIDTATDTYIKTFENAKAQGVVLAADGNVWMMATKKLYCINPKTAEITKEVDINQSVACQWGSWRHTNFLAAKKKNVLYWMDGAAWSGSGNIYAWDMTGDVPTEPLFTLGKREGMNGNTQSQYGTIGYDDANDRLMLATTHGASSNYRYNWYYFVDGSTGEELKSFALTPYYWFPAMPVNPDRAEVTTDLEKIDLDNYDDPKTMDLTDHFTDADDIDSEITLSIVPSNDTQLENIADVTIEGKQLTITPKTFGDATLRLRSVSRGHVAYHDIAVKIAKVGVDDVAVDTNDSAIEYYNLQGVRVDADNLTPGVYVRRQGNKAVKVIIK